MTRVHQPHTAFKFIIEPFSSSCQCVLIYFPCVVSHVCQRFSGFVGRNCFFYYRSSAAKDKQTKRARPCLSVRLHVFKTFDKRSQAVRHGGVDQKITQATAKKQFKIQPRVIFVLDYKYNVR